MRAIGRGAAGIALACVVGACASAADAAPVAIVNPGFESTKPGVRGDPEGWTAIQHAGPLSYTFKRDADVRHGDAASQRVDNVGPEPFGAVFQQLSAATLRGRTVRLTAWLRTRGVSGSGTGGGAVLTLQAMQGGALLAHEHMAATPVKGTTDWTRCEIALAIPRAADQVEIGAMLHGPGTMWLDDVELAVE